VDGARVNEGTLGLGGLLRLGEWLGILVEIPAERAERPDGFREVVPGYWAGPTLWPVLEPLQAAAVTQVPVLIVGETGTGKEGVARSVHAWSARTGRLVAVNCAAIPENLAEGELFGYRRGAFTGAERAHDGVVRAAHKGTLFLDEVADLPQSLQPKLLRALEQREVTPIGEATPVSVDVRMVAAMQQPLSQAVEEKRFRPDLYARLDGLTVKLPPLRERLDEVPFLFCQFLKHHLGGRAMPVVETPLIEALCRYAWPFNVRELDRVVQQLVALHGFDRTLSRSMLPEKILAGLATDTSSAAPRPTPEAALEALTQEGGNVRKAADRLLLSRQQLYRLLEGIPDFDLESFRKDLAARRLTEDAE
jgi:transcriptional regulator with PAS, ATPase and Fis domain